LLGDLLRRRFRAVAICAENMAREMLDFGSDADIEAGMNRKLLIFLWLMMGLSVFLNAMLGVVAGYGVIGLRAECANTSCGLATPYHYKTREDTAYAWNRRPGMPAKRIMA
jgi:hypothetical protein